MKDEGSGGPGNIQVCPSYCGFIAILALDAFDEVLEEHRRSDATRCTTSRLWCTRELYAQTGAKLALDARSSSPRL